MCGIFCTICHKDEKNTMDQIWSTCKPCIERRGPDDTGQWQENFKDVSCSFAASVLWMQGPSMFKQPCVDEKNNVLLWNGDIFSNNFHLDGRSDSEAVLDLLKPSLDIKDVVTRLEQIQGPFSFVYFHNSQKTLYFGRDSIGRHSLLIQTEKRSLTLSSVLTRDFEDAVELPATGIFSLDIDQWHWTHFPWARTKGSEDIRTFAESWGTPINIIERPGQDERHQELDVESAEFGRILGQRDAGDIMKEMLSSEVIKTRVDELLSLLESSVEVRVQRQPNICRFCLKSELESGLCSHSKIGVAFSGGLDSTLLALVADKIVPSEDSIDLINVAFETKKGYGVPDRITGEKSVEELRRLCPGRTWNFVEVNVTREELESCRESRVADLVHPLKTILDDSLGCAVWFASRARGTLLGRPYESGCRVVFLGQGADELFGGYMRHRTTLRHKGWKALHEEMDNEIRRISMRNLGRDDRVVADNGRQARFPFLDERVVDFATSLPPWDRCWPTEELPCGFGDKLLLRLAALRLNLRQGALFPKRAFQFGSRIANPKENAKDASSRLRTSERAT